MRSLHNLPWVFISPFVFDGFGSLCNDILIINQTFYVVKRRFPTCVYLDERKEFCDNKSPNGGAVVQLGERLTGSQEVVGSNPISSTTQNSLFPLILKRFLDLLFLA